MAEGPNPNQSGRQLKDGQPQQVHRVNHCFTVDNFESRRQHNEVVYSEPFFTHPQGYKMCVQVYPNGFGKAEGTHLTVSTCILRGEYDDQLLWPFRGEIVVELLNQVTEDKDHHKQIIQYDRTTPNKYAGKRITAFLNSRNLGWGHATFISNRELKPYLKDDCLKVRVRDVYVRRKHPIGNPSEKSSWMSKILKLAQRKEKQGVAQESVKLQEHSEEDQIMLAEPEASEMSEGAAQGSVKPQELSEEDQIMLAELEKALRDGYFLTDLTTTLASGAPGVGKTCLRHFVFGEKPPSLRISTECIEQAQRAVLRELPAGGGAECKRIETEQLKGMIASDFKVGTPYNRPTSDDQSSHPDKVTASQSQQPLQTIDMEDDFKSESIGTHPRQPDHSTSMSATPLDHSTGGGLLQLKEISEIIEKMKLIKTSSGSQQLDKVHWIHFIDAGGQEEFMDILPAFVRNVSLYLPVVKLSEKLSDIPDAAYYYDKNGKCHELSPFIHTNKELLIQAANFASFHQPSFPFPNLEDAPDHLMLMVIGTFKDQENNDETIKDKNELLMKLLEPFLEQQILIRPPDQKVIFAVDNRNPEDPIASELRTAIRKHAPRLRLKMPPQWYLLELELRNQGSKVVSKSDCWAIAKKLQFESEVALDAALRYLHMANLFLYYPDILGDIVIVDPSAVIGVITQLFEKHIKLRKATESTISDEALRFRDQALFTAKTIESCNVSNEKALLPNDSLINLFQHRHIVAKIAPEAQGGVTSFFMPSLLQDSHNLGKFSPGVATPLYIAFPGNRCTPNGLYCALVVGLLSSEGRFQWRIHALHSTPVAKLHKNRIGFTINDHPGIVTLVNAKTHYEVHPSSDFPADLVHHLLNAIDDSLKQACSRFSYRVVHQFGFACTCGDHPPHPAIIIYEKTIVKCTENSRYTQPMSQKQKLWLPQKTKQDEKKRPMVEQKPKHGMEEESVAAEKRPLQQLFDEKEEMAAKKDDQLIEQEKEIVKLKKQLVEKDGQLSSLRAELEELRNVMTTVSPTAKFHHHKFDPAYPGICFLGDPWQETVTSEGKVVSWSDIGIKFTIPPGAVPEDRSLMLTVRPCLSGPFVLPQDYDLSSPMYLIQPAFDFHKEVELAMSHFANINSDEDLESMTFISARSKPVRGRSGPEYRLRVLPNGVFREGESTGTISLKHFCILGKGRKRSRSNDDEAPEAEKTGTKRIKGKYLYSVLLYEIPSASQTSNLLAIFCVSLYHKVHIQNLTRSLEEQYSHCGVKFWPTVKEPVHLSKDKVSLILPSDVAGWNIVPNKRPCEFTRDEVDVPLQLPDYHSTCSYPPTIKLQFICNNQDMSQKAQCVDLFVRGLVERLSFPLLLSTQSYLQSPPMSPPEASPGFHDREYQRSPREPPLRSSWSPERKDVIPPPTNAPEPRDGGESPESKTIRTNLTRITEVLSSAVSPMWFAQKLEEEALMDDATTRVQVLGVPELDSVGGLMNAVKTQIKTASKPVEEFTKFIRILHSKVALKNLLQRLLKEYGKNGGNPDGLKKQLDSQGESDD